MLRTTASRALLGAGILLLALAPRAAATPYTVVSACDAGVARYDGWKPVQIGSTGALTAACSGGDVALHGELVPTVAHGQGDTASWSFSAPADTSVVAISGSRFHSNADARDGATPVYQLNGGSTVLEYCAAWEPCTYMQDRAGGGTARYPFNYSFADASSLQAVVYCGGGAAAPCLNDGRTTQFTLTGVRVTLADRVDPVVGSVGGTLLDATPKSGVETVDVSASDSGSGVYRARVTVDGADVLSAVVDGNDGRCAPFGDPARREFLYRVPCKLAASTSLGYDTRALSEGEHTVEVHVSDAAGNEVRAAGPTTITVDNIGAPGSVTAPTTSGTTQEGRTLLAGRGEWDLHGRDAATSFAYRWERCAADGSGCAVVGGAGGQTYDLSHADAYHRLRVFVTAQNSEGSTTAVSALTEVVRDAEGRTAPAGPDGRSAASALSADSLLSASSTRGEANGAGASDVARLEARFAASRSAALTVRYGRRVVVSGRLVDGAGAPIRGARLDLVNNVPGAVASVDDDVVRTRQDGSFSFVLPSDVSSRTLAVRYRSHLADIRPVAEAALRLAVRAGLTLAITPRTSHNHGTIRFSGRLRGRPVPIRGKIVELQARGKGGGRWLTFKTLRTDAAGRFHARYRFRATYGPVTYEFRARSREDAGYPYATGASRIVAVRVR